MAAAGTMWPSGLKARLAPSTTFTASGYVGPANFEDMTSKDRRRAMCSKWGFAAAVFLFFVGFSLQLLDLLRS